MTKIFCHHDADGLTSAYLTSFGVPEPEIIVVEKFGDTSKWVKGSYMVDMKPDDPNIEGIVIDHHPDHPSLAERKYSLTWETKPASILCWQKFKDSIPKSQWWKTVIGAVGDGQAEKIPFEIWNECPALMQYTNTFISHSYGEWKVSYRPVYQLLSSGINAFARYGDYNTPLKIMEKCKTPFDLISNSQVNMQKSKLSNTKSGDFAKVLQDARVYPLNNLTYIVYNSPNIRLSGYIASVIQSNKDVICALAVNEDNGSLSLRGDNANYIKGILSKLDYVTVDGHDGFCYDRETRVLTKDGFKYFKDVTLKDDILTRNPKTHELEYIKPEKKVQYIHDKMIHFKGERNIDLMVTPDHDMAYISDHKYKKGDREITFRKASTITYWDMIPTGGGIWKGHDDDNIIINNTSYDTEWFSKFMGIFLSEGWVTRLSKNCYRINIAQSQEHNIEICKYIESLINGFDYTYNEEKSTYYFTDKNLGEYLIKHKKMSYEKYIPKEIKNLSPYYINKFLEYFRYGDGSKRERLYYTSSKKMAEDLAELILKCNRKPNIISRNDIGDSCCDGYKTKHNGYIIYDNDRIYGRLDGKSIKEIDYNDIVYCLTMPKNHTLFVERNGKMIWSGNCGGKVNKHPNVLLNDLMELL
jgi:hypothetical protein